MNPKVAIISLMTEGSYH